MILKHTVSASDEGEKVLTILKRRLNCSGTLIKRLKANNTIYLNGTPTFSNVRVQPGDEVSVEILEHRVNEKIIPQDIPLDILFEDDYLIIVNKPPHLAVHPAGKYKDGTLANALRNYFLARNIDMTVRPVGRLDRNTSGVMLFAKNSHVMSRMIETMKNPSSAKLYTGLVHGIPEEDSGLIDLPIKRAVDSIIARVSSSDGRPARTRYCVIEKYAKASLLEYELLTGRTHQIRLHSKEIGCPLVGDGIYGDDSETMHIIDRHALHCSKVSFFHPFTLKSIKISSPLPDDIRAAIDHYKK
jgi:23S rRNA pseudouridine1911/1915/1917 synthase